MTPLGDPAPSGPELLGLAATKDLIARLGVSPSKGLGQNFVIDPNIVERMVRRAGVGPGDTVCEIGPGLGSLTRALLRAGVAVTAVEFDPTFAPVLDDLANEYPLRLVWDDAVTVDLDAVSDCTAVVANLPYSTGTKVLLRLLDEAPNLRTFTVMVQKEVGQRLCASPGTKTFGIPTLKVAAAGRARIVDDIPPTVFLPEPHVDSVVVHIERTELAVPGHLEATWDRLIRTAFASRRKMLRRSLAALVPEAAFADAVIDPQRRPETLELAEWVRLAEAVTAQ